MTDTAALNTQKIVEAENASASATEEKSAATTATAPRKRGKQKQVRIPHVVFHINASFSNTYISVTDPHGNVKARKGGGECGFKGARKGTPFAAQEATRQVAAQAKDLLGATSCDIKVKGIASGREPAIRAVAASGFDIKSIEDVTPIPHNGVRRRKKRRV